MATFLFVLADYTGHFNSTLRIAARLRERGHRVVYLTSPNAPDRVADHGFELRRAAFLLTMPNSLRPTAGTFGIRRWIEGAERLRQDTLQLAEALDRAPAEVASLVDELAPDALVFDPFLLMYAILFHPFRLPVIALSTKPLLTFDPWVPPYTSGLVPRPPFRRATVAFAWHVRRLRYAAYRSGVLLRLAITGWSPYRLCRRMAQVTDFPLEDEWDMRPLSFDFHWRTIPEVVLTASELELPRLRPLPADVRYAGPCVALDRVEEPWEGDRLLGTKPLVYAALGTVSHGSEPLVVAFLKELIEAFRLRPGLLLVLSTGTAAPELSLDGSLPPNVYVFRSVPQLRVLRHADVFVSHGGASSVKEGILLEVPLLVYPRRADQPGNAARVVYHGLGRKGDYRRDTHRQIGRLVDSLRKDVSVRASLARMRQQMLRYERADLDVAAFEDSLRRRAKSSVPEHRTAKLLETRDR